MSYRCYSAPRPCAIAAECRCDHEPSLHSCTTTMAVTSRACYIVVKWQQLLQHSQPMIAIANWMLVYCMYCSSTCASHMGHATAPTLGLGQHLTQRVGTNLLKTHLCGPKNKPTNTKTNLRRSPFVGSTLSARWRTSSGFQMVAQLLEPLAHFKQCTQ